jgi:hypothetical protein
VARRIVMKRFLTIAAVLLLVHGLIELMALFAFVSPTNQPSFIFEELTRNWQYAVWIGVISGILRMLAAIGIFANRKWGLVLGVLISMTTLVSLTFYLPFGVMDALLAGAVLTLLVVFNYGTTKIVG